MSNYEFSTDDISNDGERLIPFISHDYAEAVRHIGSHSFFAKILNKDTEKAGLKDLEILDLGFGTGYASYIYASLPSVKTVTAIDVSDELLKWAKTNYYNDKITYKIGDAKKILEKSKPYTYIFTRHVLEHIEGGLDFLEERHFTNRLCINVPFNEKPGNPYHVVTKITKESFPKYKNVEYFYEDLNGVTYKSIPKDVFINSIICIASKNGIPKVGEYFNFPLAPPAVEEQFLTLAEGNPTFVRNVLNSHTKLVAGLRTEVVQLPILKDEVKNLTADIKKVTDELIKVSNELAGIKSSKRWRYSASLTALLKGKRIRQ